MNLTGGYNNAFYILGESSSQFLVAVNAVESYTAIAEIILKLSSLERVSYNSHFIFVGYRASYFMRIKYLNFLGQLRE